MYRSPNLLLKQKLNLEELEVIKNSLIYRYSLGQYVDQSPDAYALFHYTNEFFYYEKIQPLIVRLSLKYSSKNKQPTKTLSFTKAEIVSLLDTFHEYKMYCRKNNMMFEIATIELLKPRLTDFLNRLNI